MRRVNPNGRRPVENTATMPERLTLITELLQDAREAQEKGNSMLADLRVDVAAMQRAQTGQAEHIADLRAEQRQMSDRLRTVELQLQPVADLQRQHRDLEARIRTLEGDGREAKLVNRAVTGGARDVWRYTVGVVGGLLLAAALWAVKQGGTPV